MRMQRKAGRVDESQFDLFASTDGVALPTAAFAETEKTYSPAHTGSKAGGENGIAGQATVSQTRIASVNAARKRRRVEPVVRIVAREDLPNYRDDECNLVEQTLAQLPRDKLWFTYADIARVFTVSRATIKRRAKAGMIPDIRFEGERVLEDGAIRRFTREQVRYLLLSLRRR